MPLLVPILRRAALWLSLFSCFLVSCPLRGQAQDLDELLESARAAQSAGHYRDAADLYAQATLLSPSTPELWSNRGVMEFLGGQLDAATVSLKHALQLNPSLFAPMFFLGKSYVQAGKPGLALPYLTRAHDLRKNDAEVLLALGKANADSNRQRQAAAFYADAARLAPENAAAWFGLGVASLGVITANGRALAAAQPQSIWAQALYADELLAQGRPVEALDKYEAVLAGASLAQKATLARTLEWMQNHPDLFPLQPNSQDALNRLHAKLVAEQNVTALPSCATGGQDHRQSSKVAGKPASALSSAACAYWAGNYELSVSNAWQALLHNPQSAEALYWSVKANERVGVEALSRFEDLAPRSAANYVLIGDLFRHQQDADSALGEYKKALAIDAHDPAALMGAAAAYLSSGKMAEAALMDKAALAGRPLDPQLNLLMAEILAATNQFEEAKMYLAKCDAAPPELQPRVHYLLGRADAEAGETQEAIRQFEQALPGDDDGSIHYQLSRLYRKMSNRVQAEKSEAEAKTLVRRRDANAAVAVREAINKNTQ